MSHGSPRLPSHSTPGRWRMADADDAAPAATDVSDMLDTAPRPRPATLREVASAAKLDISTVSRALRPETRNRVRPETVKRVLATADALGYRANPFARG